MRKILFGVVITLIVVFTFKFCEENKEHITIQENSILIQEQLKNVDKLVVTEGHFSEVIFIPIPLSKVASPNNITQDKSPLGLNFKIKMSS